MRAQWKWIGLALVALVVFGRAEPPWVIERLLPPVEATYFPSTMTRLTGVTVGNATASGENTVATIPIPANSWADGEFVRVWLPALAKNDSGISQNTLVKFQAGAGSLVTVGTIAWADSATEFNIAPGLVLQRVGADVWGYYVNPSDGNISIGLVDGFDNITAGTVEPVASTPTNFTTTFNLLIGLNLAATDATYYFTTKSSLVWRSLVLSP